MPLKVLTFSLPLVLGMGAGSQCGGETPRSYCVAEIMPRGIFHTDEQAVFGGMMVRASRPSEFLVLGLFGLARVQHRQKMRRTRGKGWRFFEWVSQKILPEPCAEHSPLLYR